VAYSSSIATTLLAPRSDKRIRLKPEEPGKAPATIPNSKIIFPSDGVHPVVKPLELPNQIPLSLLQELSEVDDLSDFLQYVDNVTLVPSSAKELEPRLLGTEGIVDVRGSFGRDAVTRAVAAKCMPELQTVQLMISNDPTVLFFPSCTRMERCGGCCTSDLYSCQPVEQETVFVQVIKTQYTGGTRMKYAGKEIVPVEKHTACKCQCKIKESDCTESQEYDARSCQCRCTNQDDRQKCESANQTRYWDVGRCICRCRLNDFCSTGFYYNEDTCQCEQWIARRSDSGIRAVLGEGGRQGNNSTVNFDQKTWSKDVKEEDEKEDKSSRPVQRFHFSNLKKPIGCAEHASLPNCGHSQRKRRNQ